MRRRHTPPEPPPSDDATARTEGTIKAPAQPFQCPDRPSRESATDGGQQGTTNTLTRALLIAAGTLLVGLGALGVVLPVLPTTPFLLLAAACYARSSQRFYTWLLRNRCFGPYIRHYREGGGLPLRQKVVAVLLLWLSIGYAACFAVSHWWLRSLLLAIAVGVTIHLATIKTRRASQSDSRPARKTRAKKLSAD